MNLTFSRIKHLLFFGGGNSIIPLIEIANEFPFTASVITSPRHADCILKNGKSFTESLTDAEVPFLITNTLNDKNVLDQITEDTLGMSFGAAWIFRSSFINLFHNRLINYHASPLPHYRGGGGYSWRIMNNDRRGCCLLHLVDEGIDTGDIVKSHDFFYPLSCRTPQDYVDYTLSQGQTFFRNFFKDVLHQTPLQRIPQQEVQSTYTPRLNTEIHGYIDWNWTHDQIVPFICAFDNPYAGSSTFYKDQKVRIKDAYTYANDGAFHPFMAGLVYRVVNQSIYVATSSGTVLLKKVLDENGQDITSSIKTGNRFYTPTQYLDTAKSYYAVYNTSGIKQ